MGQREPARQLHHHGHAGSHYLRVRRVPNAHWRGRWYPLDQHGRRRLQQGCVNHLRVKTGTARSCLTTTTSLMTFLRPPSPDITLLLSVSSHLSLFPSARSTLLADRAQEDLPASSSLTYV